MKLKTCLFILFTLPAVVIFLSVTHMSQKEESPFETIETQENENYYVDQYDSIYKIQKERLKK